MPSLMVQCLLCVIKITLCLVRVHEHVCSVRTFVFSQNMRVHVCSVGTCVFSDNMCVQCSVRVHVHVF